jgi:hypothetical protein
VDDVAPVLLVLFVLACAIPIILVVGAMLLMSVLDDNAKLSAWRTQRRPRVGGRGFDVISEVKPPRENG